MFPDQWRNEMIQLGFIYCSRGKAQHLQSTLAERLFSRRGALQDPGRSGVVVMLELVRTLFEPDQRSSRTEETPRSRDSLRPRFDPGLIDALTAAQSDLFGHIASVTAGSRARNFVATMGALARLDRGLHTYMIDASKLFDDHLWHILRRDSGALALMRGVCAHLDELARYVRELVALHRAGQLCQRDFARIAQEIDSLAQALEHCLQTQAERLFPLYRPVDEPEARQFGRLIAM